VLDTRAATGIDGVSLGGRVALLAGFRRPDVFGAIGTLQAAVRSGEVGEFAERAKRAADQVKGGFALRLLTSDRDPFLPTLKTLSEVLGRLSIPAQFEVIPGPHDYDFNRGPGGYQMLMWHERVLRGEPPME
jgi:enterochelin esterase-like enzyme